MLQRPGVTAPIVGATKPGHLTDALAAEQLGSVTTRWPGSRSPTSPTRCSGTSDHEAARWPRGSERRPDIRSAAGASGGVRCGEQRGTRRTTEREPLTDPPSGVDFHFDIMCPYAYQTSLWIREVRDLTGMDVRWRFFSLEEINRAEGKKHPWEREWSYGWSMMRIGPTSGARIMELLDSWYRAAGRALHVEGRKPHRPEVAEELLAEMGLDPGIVRAAIDDPTTATRSTPSTTSWWPRVGSGCRRSVFDDGQALFGPVLVNPPPGGGRAAVGAGHGMARIPHVYELQRPKGAADIDTIATAFAPYLEARDWFSVQRPTP